MGWQRPGGGQGTPSPHLGSLPTCGVRANPLLDLKVVGPEVVAPLTETVGLIHGDEANLSTSQYSPQAR